MGKPSRRAVLIAAVAATVTSAVFQLSLVIWPDVIKQHSVYVIAGWVLAGLLWLWWFVIRLLEGSDKERPTTGLIQHSHGIANTGTMGDVTYNNTYNSHQSTDSKDDLKRSSPTASEWDALGDRFLKCSKFARVDYQITRGVTRWDVKEDKTLEALCVKAGAMLLKSPKSRSALMPMLPNEEDTLSQWLEIVKRRAVSHNTGYGTEHLDDGSSLLHTFGSISGLADASYRLCMECSAYEI
jgi:hypothetical protein